MEYTFYDNSTGLIKFTVLSNSPPDGANGDYIDGRYDAETFVVVDGQAVRKSDSEIEQAEIAEAWVDLKKRRHALLIDSDWTQASDAPVDQAAWAVYRQALRDLPDNTTDPRNVIWPLMPS